MVVTMEERVGRLERELGALEGRLARLEGERVGVAGPAVKPAAAPRPSESRAPVGAAVARARDLEELLGGRLLALAGGLAVMLGLVFLVGLAIERGWLGEAARVTLAFAGAGVLLFAGAWLYETRGRTQAALAMVGTGVAGLYLALTAATALYGLLPVSAALPLALAIGAVATALAVRIDSRTVAGLGILGALASPVLAGSFPSDRGVLFLAVAYGASAAVPVWRRWDWLRVAAFLVASAQVGDWAVSEPQEPRALVTVLALFTALGLASALAYEVRIPRADLRPSAALLVCAGAAAYGWFGYEGLADAAGDGIAGIWLAALAAVDAALGAAALAARRTAPGIGLLLLAVALATADVSFAVLVDGTTLALGWAASAAVLAVGWRRFGGGLDFARFTLAGQLTLAVAHLLRFEAPPEGLVDGVEPLLDAALAGGAIAVAAFALARPPLELWGRARPAFLVLGGGTVVYVTSVGIATAFQPDAESLQAALGLDVREQGQALMSAFWGLSGLGLLWAGLRRDRRGLRLAGFSLLALAVAKLFLYDLAALDSAYRVVSFVGVGLLLLAGAYAYQRMRTDSRPASGAGREAAARGG